MTVDYAASLYDPIYERLGVAAVIEIAGLTAPVDVTVIDKSRSHELFTAVGRDLAQRPAVRGLRAAATVRVPELTARGVSREDLRDALITFNEQTWVIKVTDSRPAPTGEAAGELLLLLTESAGD